MYRDEQESLSVNTSYKLNRLLTFGTVSLFTLRSIYSQGHELSRVALDILMPRVLQHASPDTLGHALRRVAQNQDSLSPIDDRELEEMGVRFLASISDSPHWSNDLSVPDENDQTIAHLCVLSGYTRLLTKVVDWGIDLDVRDVSGLTALHFAYLREDWDCVRILKEAGANEDIKDDLGRIPRKMCRHVESGSTTYSEGEASSTLARFAEEDWVDVPSRVSASPENFTLVGTRSMLRLPWGSPGDLKAVGGIRASPMPMPGPPSEESSIADDESWASAFSNLQISESPPPLARAPSVASSSTRRGGEAPQYGWSHRTNPLSPPGVQRSVSSGASAKFHSFPATSSFSQGPTFPMPNPAVPLFPVAEPVGYQDESDDYAGTMSLQPSSRRSSPSLASSPVSRHQTPAQTPPSHGLHDTRSNLLDASTAPLSFQRTQRSYQPSPGTPSTRYVPPAGPPPSEHFVSPPGVVPGSLPQLEKDEKAAVRYQLQEIMRVLPSADQEKEKQSMKFKMEQKTVTLTKGALADTKALTQDHFQQSKQGEA